jgi:beta-galactosidase/beta-glucuronidase
MPIHRIRLRHPWLCEPQPDAVVWRRRFNRPTGLGPEERVFLVVERLATPGTIVLNGQPLGQIRGEAGPQSFDVTDTLELSNELTLRLQSPPPDDPHRSSSLPGEVCLEIHSAEG